MCIQTASRTCIGFSTELSVSFALLFVFYSCFYHSWIHSCKFFFWFAIRNCFHARCEKKNNKNGKQNPNTNEDDGVGGKKPNKGQVDLTFKLVTVNQTLRRQAHDVLLIAAIKRANEDHVLVFIQWSRGNNVSLTNKLLLSYPQLLAGKKLISIIFT